MNSSLSSNEACDCWDGAELAASRTAIKTCDSAYNTLYFVENFYNFVPLFLVSALSKAMVSAVADCKVAFLTCRYLCTLHTTALYYTIVSASTRTM